MNKIEKNMQITDALFYDKDKFNDRFYYVDTNCLNSGNENLNNLYHSYEYKEFLKKEFLDVQEMKDSFIDMVLPNFKSYCSIAKKENASGFYITYPEENEVNKTRIIDFILTFNRLGADKDFFPYLFELLFKNDESTGKYEHKTANMTLSKLFLMVETEGYTCMYFYLSLYKAYQEKNDAYIKDIFDIQEYIPKGGYNSRCDKVANEFSEATIDNMYQLFSFYLRFYQNNGIRNTIIHDFLDTLIYRDDSYLFLISQSDTGLLEYILNTNINTSLPVVLSDYRKFVSDIYMNKNKRIDKKFHFSEDFLSSAIAFIKEKLPEYCYGNKIDNILLGRFINMCVTVGMEFNFNLFYALDATKDNDNLYSDIDIKEIFAHYSGMDKEIIMDIKTIALLNYIKENKTKKFFSKIKHILIEHPNIFNDVQLSNLRQIDTICDLANYEDDEILLLFTRYNDLIRVFYKLDNIGWKLNFKEIVTLAEMDKIYLQKSEKKAIFNNLKVIKKLNTNNRCKRIRTLFEVIRIAKNTKCNNIVDFYPLVLSGDIPSDFQNRNPLGISTYSEYIPYWLLFKKGYQMNTYNEFVIYKISLIINNYDFNAIDKTKTYQDIIQESMQEGGIVYNFFIDKNKLNFDKEFVARNFNSIIEFMQTKAFEIANSYLSNNYIKSQVYRKNFSLIIKSLILNKYDRLKFNIDDCRKEIQSRDISNLMFETWKYDGKYSQGTYAVSEHSDFNSIMTIGTEPVHTCQSYKNGSYSECLLANFDNCKKIIKVYKDGRLLGRAILRFAKYSDKDKIGTAGHIQFIDFDLADTDKTSSNQDERLCIFVEKLYTSAGEFDIKKNMIQTMNEYLSQKAKEMNVSLFYSDNYGFYLNKIDNAIKDRRFNILVSASKNGMQYIDSLTGSTGTSKEYTWMNIHAYQSV